MMMKHIASWNNLALDFLKNIIHTHMIITLVVCQTHAAQAINNLQ